jgi:CheY-like chemotaxis protein
VVDDSLTARALNRTSLESGGFVVHTASDGRQALEQLRSNAYEVLVTDIGMPGLDGFELTQTVRTRHLADGMAIVLVTARDSDVDRGRGRDSGAEGFVSKRECASGRLLGEVASAIARRRGGAA